jgi:hypothetical protein
LRARKAAAMLARHQPQGPPGPTVGGNLINVDEPVSYGAHIKPMFRERDRRSMLSHFDLWSHDDVSQHADAILARLQAGTMPCDGAWPRERVDLFRRWVDSGKPN